LSGDAESSNEFITISSSLYSIIKQNDVEKETDCYVNGIVCLIFLILMIPANVFWA
jgi:hypothetical protein